MRTELVDISTAYLIGWKTIRDCAEWLASIDWDDPAVDPESLNMAGRLELLATEVFEGLRPEADFRQEAVEFVARETNSIYSQLIFMADVNVTYSSSTDKPSWLPGFTMQVAGVSQSWSISPLPVSA